MTYKEYATANGHSQEEIEKSVGCLFGSGAQMQDILGTCSYDMGSGYILNVDNSTYDTVDLVLDGEIMESWSLEY